jgi:hypothetical protein
MQVMQQTNTPLSHKQKHTHTYTAYRATFFFFETKPDVHVLSNYSLLYRLLVLKYQTLGTKTSTET